MRVNVNYLSNMAWYGVLGFLFAISWVEALPKQHLLVFPENLRDGTSRIVSGWEAKEGQIPYQLSLRMVATDGGVFSCGATILHSEWALTAAHCTAQRITILLRVGSVELIRPQLLIETTEYYNHPLYIEALQGRVQPHDIGVIKLNYVLAFNDRIQPIRLQPSVDKNKNYHGIRLQASGWGRTWTGGSAPQILNWVFLVGTTNEHCRAALNNSPNVVASTICAGHYNVTSQSTCHGDSGGPLVEFDEDGTVTQVGVASFVSGTGCHTGFPAGFIRPGHYHDWFTEVTGIDFDWNRSPPTTNNPENSNLSF